MDAASGINSSVFAQRHKWLQNAQYVGEELPAHPLLEISHIYEQPIADPVSGNQLLTGPSEDVSPLDEMIRDLQPELRDINLETKAQVRKLAALQSSHRKHS